MVTEKQKENLKAGKKRGLTTEEAQRIGKKGGEKSAEARKARKECLQFTELAKALVSNEDQEKMIKAISTFAQEGSLPHFEMIVKLMGQTLEDANINNAPVSFADEEISKYAD